jgi:FAD/FMN-containing dehydrogenase
MSLDPADDLSVRPPVAPGVAVPLATRRGVLAAAATLGGFAILGRASPLAAAPQISDRAWKHLARSLSGSLLRPGDKGFKATARPNNLVYADRLPAGIARCRTPEDVAAAILWCRENDVRFVARAGGHNYAGYSTTRGLMIDVGRLDDIAFDAKSGRVTVGAGVRNRDLYAALSRVGVAITHGRCYGVGVSGFLLGGGIGFDMRLHGIGSDKLMETHVVGADGEIRTARANHQPDLFWACRGGAGGNFGINTRFVVETFAVEDITAFDITWSRKPEAVAEALIAALQGATRRLGSKISLRAVTPQDRRAGRDVRVNLLGQLHGRRAELLDILAPVFAVAPALKQTIRTGPYWEEQKLLSEEGGPEHYRERSRFVRRAFGTAALGTAFRQARRFPGTGGSASLKLFQTGKTVNALPGDATAFVHRDSQWLFTTSFTFEKEDGRRAVAAATDWMDETYEAMVPFCGEGAFQNFPDPALKDWARQYYGTNLARLRRIKAAVDPDDVFRFGQSIRPAG